MTVGGIIGRAVARPRAGQGRGARPTGERADRAGRACRRTRWAATRTSSAAASGSASASRARWPSKPEFIVARRAGLRAGRSIQAQIINLLASCSGAGLTYLFIAHDLSVVRHISDRVAVMYLGKVVGASPRTSSTATRCIRTRSRCSRAVPDPRPGDRDASAGAHDPDGDVPSPVNPPSGCRFHTRCWLRRELQNPERCVKERPVLRELLPDHTVACHLRGGAARQGPPRGAGRQGRRGDHRADCRSRGGDLAPPGRRRDRRGRPASSIWEPRIATRSDRLIGAWNTGSPSRRSRRASARWTRTSSWRGSWLRRAVGRGRAAGRLPGAGADRLPALGPRAGGGDARRRPAPGGAEPRGAGDVLLAIGFVEETDEHRFSNSAALLRDGELLALHRKVYLPTYGMFDEGRFTRAGDRIRTHRRGGAAGTHRPLRLRGLLARQPADAPGAGRRLAAGQPGRRPGAGTGQRRRHWRRSPAGTRCRTPTRCSGRWRSPSATGSATRRGSPSGAARACWPPTARRRRGAALRGGAGGRRLETDDLRMQRYSLPLLADERLELVRRELDRDHRRACRPAGARGDGASSAEPAPLPADRRRAGGGGDHRLHPLTAGADRLRAAGGGPVRRGRFGDRRLPGGARGRRGQPAWRADAVPQLVA